MQESLLRLLRACAELWLATKKMLFFVFIKNRDFRKALEPAKVPDFM